jgi:hypothetical protein
MQTLRRLSVHVGIHGAKVSEKKMLEKQDNCQLRDGKSHQETRGHSQTTSLL